MKHSTGKPTKAEKQRFEDLLEIGCIACHPRYVVPQIYHLLSGNKRRGHMFTIPLCPWHHQSYCLLSYQYMTRNHGPSLALNPKAFRDAFGTDDGLLEKVNSLLKEKKEKINV